MNQNNSDNMDRKLPKKKFIVKYKYPIIGGALFLCLLVYIIISSSGASKLRIDKESLRIENVKNDKFMEYVDVEGTTQPILTIMVNTRESGSVKDIIAEEGTFLKKGDTILTLENIDLIRDIEEKRDEWNKILTGHQEKVIEMEQKTLTLKEQTLQAIYELSKLQKSYELDREEFQMGVKSKAQLEVAKDAYEFNLKKTELQLENLRHDSTVSIIRRKLMENDLERERKKFQRTEKSLEELVVRAPIDGQLSFLSVAPGQVVNKSGSIGEIKDLSNFKIKTSLSEFYIDRVTSGLPATITYQQKKYPLRITKVVPEVKDRMFTVELIFSDTMPDNVTIGKSYRVQVELGQPEEVVVIPRGNFFQATGGQWIFKVNKDETKAIKQPITIGRQNPQQYEIIEGLEPGEKVIVTGYDNFGDVQELVLK